MLWLWRPFAWWNGLGRQKRVGWLLVGISTFYILYFIRGRLLEPGPPIVTKEWIWFVLSFGGVMLGTVNIRMAEMRERNQRVMPLVDPSQTKAKRK